jgi:hypothetical protein
VVEPAVDDAVADADQARAAAVVAQEGDEVGERAVVAEARSLVPPALGDRFAGGVAGDEVRPVEERLELAA